VSGAGFLPPAVVACLMERCGSLDEAVTKAKALPGFAEEIAKVEAERLNETIYPRDPPLPAGALESRLWTLVAVAHGCFPREGEAPPPKRSKLSRRDPIPEATLVQVVRGLRAKTPKRRVAREARLRRSCKMKGSTFRP